MAKSLDLVARFFAVDVNAGDGFDKLSQKVNRMAGQYAEFGKQHDDFINSALKMATVGTAATALIPTLGVATAGVGALGAAFASAGVGAAGFAAVAVPEIEKLTKANQALEAAKKQAAAATTPTQRVAALKAEHAALAGLTGGELKTAASLRHLGDEWEQFTKTLRPQVLNDVNVAVNTAGKLLPKLEPVVRSAANAFGILEKHAAVALGGKQFAGIFSTLAKTAGPAIVHLGDSLGHVAEGVAGILKAFAPLGDALGKELDKATGRFAKWGLGLSQNAGFKGFIDYVKAQAPKVGAILSSIGVTAGHLVKALAPIGSVVLSALKSFAGALRQIPVPVLTAVAAAVLPATLAVKAFSAAGAIAETVTKAWAVATKVMAGAQAALDAVMDANPILLAAAAVVGLGVAFYEAYKHSKTFRRIVDDVGRALKTAFVASLHAAQSAIHALEGAAKATWHGIDTAFHAIVHAAQTVYHGVTHAFGDALSFIKSIPGRILHGLGDLSQLLVHVGEQIIGGLWNGIKSGFGGIIHGLHSFVGKLEFWKGSPSLADMAPTLLTGVGRRIMGGLGAGLTAGQPAAIRTLHGAARLLAEGLIGGWTGEAGRIKNALSTPIQNALNHLDSIVKSAIDKQNARLKAAHSTLKSALGSRASDITSLAGTISGGAGLSSLFGTDANGNPTIANVNTFLSSQIGPLAAFAQDLKWAHNHGLNSGLLSQIANLGPVQGDQILKQFTSGMASIAQANAAESSINRYANMGATTTEDALYRHTLVRDRNAEAKQERILERMEHHLAEIERHAAQDVARHITLEIKSDGKVKFTEHDARQIVIALDRLEKRGVIRGYVKK